MGAPSFSHVASYDNDFKIPMMVLTPRLPWVWVPPYFFKEILEWYDVVPIQLSPNSYKLAITLYILYHDEGLIPPSLEEFSYFFEIKKSVKGYFFLVVQHKHNSLGFSEGKTSNLKNWKEPFFYVWNVERVRATFNIDPGKDASSPFPWVF